jgi:monothiol glutaredoxin
MQQSILEEQLRQKIQSTIDSHRVVLFMKGTRTFPQCGFSQLVVKILSDLRVPFETVNVLSDPALREGIKQFSNWPTIPQLYIDGKFIGGCDIVREMHAKGELAPLVSQPSG